MTGKELLLLLAGTGAAAGAGGVGAAMVLDSGADTGDDNAEVLAALDGLRTSIDSTQESIDEQSTELRRMSRRVQQFEIDLAETGRKLANGSLVADTADDEADAHAALRRMLREGRVGRLGTLVKDAALQRDRADLEIQVFDDAQKALATALEGLGESLDGRVTELGTLEGATDAIRLSLGGLTKGLELRKLPEAERWDKARDEVGLSEVQIDEIKSAITERDAAVKEAMKIEPDDTGDRRLPVRIRNLDFTKAREANDAYRKRVDNTLNDQQKKDWKGKGYDNAFGDSGMGMGFSTGTVISVSTFEDSSEESSSEK